MTIIADKMSLIQRVPIFLVMVLLGYYWVTVGMFSIYFWRHAFGEEYIQIIDQRSLWIANNWSIVFTAFVLLAILGLLVKWSKYWILNALSFGIIWASSAIISLNGFKGGMCLHHESEFEFQLFLGFLGGIFPITMLMIVFYVIFITKMRLTKN